MSEINHARTVPSQHIMVKIPAAFKGFPCDSPYTVLASTHLSVLVKGLVIVVLPLKILPWPPRSSAWAVMLSIFVPHDYPSTKEALRNRDPGVKLLYRTSLGISLP
jgi:hypothetical protein